MLVLRRPHPHTPEPPPPPAPTLPWPQGLYNSTGSFTGVDSSQLTLPSTGTTLYVATTGNDSTGTGSVGSPYKTLRKAVTVLNAITSGNIVVRAGNYFDDGRDEVDGVIVVSKPVKIQAYPNESVVFRGMKDAAQFGPWTQHPTLTSLWSIPYTLKVSHARPAGYDQSETTWPYTEVVLRNRTTSPALYDNIMDVLVSATGDPDDVNNVNVTASLNALASAPANSYFVDRKNSKLYINTNPTGQSFELSHKKAFLRFYGNSAVGSAIRGLGVMGFASHNDSSDEDVATVRTVYGGNTGPFTVEYCTFAWNGGRGLSTFQCDSGSVVRNNVLAFNGSQGFFGVSSDDMEFSNNAVAYNNQRNWSTGWEGAGAKVSKCKNLLVKGNLFEGNLGRGFWSDDNTHFNIVVENWFHKNQFGFMFEVSHGLVFASNLVTNNTSKGVLLQNAGGTNPTTTGIDFPGYVYNNTFVDNNSYDLHILDTTRTSQTEDPSSFADGYDWEVYRIEEKNNLYCTTSSGTVSTSKKHVAVEHSTNARYAAQMVAMGAWDNNGYWRSASSKHANMITWQAEASSAKKLSHATLLAFRNAVEAEDTAASPYGAAYNSPFYETNRIVHDGTTEADPWFIDSAGTGLTDRNFALRPGVDARTGATALPDRVADALGVPHGTVPIMGAFKLTGA